MSYRLSVKIYAESVHLVMTKLAWIEKFTLFTLYLTPSIVVFTILLDVFK